jgi:prepilin-type N-terminal cleavage/methylation domain-containing protein
MTTLSKRGNRGFTLIELLIVVIIIAILAAIAIPQFSSSTIDAQAAAMDANLASMRTAVEQYRVQHNGVYPGDAATALADGDSCPTGGSNTTATAGTREALNAQLQLFSNATGATCTVGGGAFKYGPYLRQGIPTEPINSVATVAMTSTNKPITATAAGGWAYDTKSGQFIMNSTAMDTGSPSRAYSAH